MPVRRKKVRFGNVYLVKGNNVGGSNRLLVRVRNGIPIVTNNLKLAKRFDSFAAARTYKRHYSKILSNYYPSTVGL